MTKNDVDIVGAIASQLIREQRLYVGEHGVAVEKSWQALDDIPNQAFANTFQVTAGKTAAIIGDDGDTGFAKPRIDVASTIWGGQYAPRGNERVVMLPTESSPIGFFLHGNDDSCPILKPGEFILRHFEDEAPAGGTATANASIHFTNDAVSTGDNLGAILVLAGGFLSTLTASGYGMTVTDSSGAIVMSATTVAIGNGNTTTITVGGSGTTTEIGGSGTSTNDGVVRKSDLVTLLSNIQTKLDAWASTSLQGGSGAAGPTTLTSIQPTASTATFTA